MSKVTLQAHRLRKSKLVEDKEAEPVTLEWPALIEKLAPTGSPNALLMLRDLRIDEFVGLRRRAGAIESFKIRQPSGNIGEILRAHPAFGSDLIEVYKVLRTEWDAQMTEPVAI